MHLEGGIGGGGAAANAAAATAAGLIGRVALSVVALSVALSVAAVRGLVGGSGVTGEQPASEPSRLAYSCVSSPGSVWV